MSLQAPWRIEYIRSLGKADAAGVKADPAAGQGVGGSRAEGCFLCDAAHADEARLSELLVLWRTDLSVVMLNRFPYTNGHVLVAPRGHVADWETMSPEQVADIGVQTQKVVWLLRRAVSAQGFNVGMNLGRVAGAGVPGHLHQHVVPRWGGDVNFMSVVGEVRVIPQALSQLYGELIRWKVELGL